MIRIMETSEEVQKRLAEWFSGSWVITALAVATERGLLSTLRGDTATDAAALAEAAGMTPALVAGLLDVLAAEGLVVKGVDGYRASAGLAALMKSPGGSMMRADLRSTLGVQHGVRGAAAEAGAVLEGWRAEDAVVVHAQGTASYLLTIGLVKNAFPRMDPELHAAMTERDCMFLDVGAGAAGGCVGFCEGYPRLKVVGIEPAAIPLAQARARIAAAGLEARIELREAGIEGVEDEGVFDAAYVAQMFIPDGPLEDGYRRVLRALKPGGKLITVATAMEGDDLAASTSRLRSTVWGGGPRTPEVVIAMLAAAGFDGVRAAPVPPGSTMAPILARRPPG